MPDSEHDPSPQAADEERAAEGSVEAAVAPAGEGPAAPSKRGLRALLLRGGLFEVGGFGVQQVLRLASNLILTRMLFPAAFGLASIVYTIATGLVMLSDVAVQQCVVQSKRGDEQAFLDTAFTLQAVRGVGLTFLMLAMGKPAAWFYREPEVEYLIYAGAAQLLFNGVHSTSIFTFRRHLRLGWLNGLDFCTGVAGTFILLGLAHYYPHPLSLVLGPVIGSLLYTVASHFLPVGYRNRFHWDKDAAREIRDFGRWVLGSSATSFLGNQSDRILLGRFLGAAWLGVYGIAVNLTEMLVSLVARILAGVIFPVLSKAAREGDRDMSHFFYRLRLRLDFLSMSAAGLLGGLGGWVIRALWDDRYANAQWMIQILSARVAISLIVTPTETCLFALAQTRYLFARSVTRLIGTFVCLPAGWYLAGVKGVIWGAVCAELPTILAVWPKARSLGILRIRRELLAVVFFVAAFALGRLVSELLPAYHLHLRGRH